MFQEIALLKERINNYLYFLITSSVLYEYVSGYISRSERRLFFHIFIKYRNRLSIAKINFALHVAFYLFEEYKIQCVQNSG